MLTSAIALILTMSGAAPPDLPPIQRPTLPSKDPGPPGTVEPEPPATSEPAPSTPEPEPTPSPPSTSVPPATEGPVVTPGEPPSGDVPAPPSLPPVPGETEQAVPAETPPTDAPRAGQTQPPVSPFENTRTPLPGGGNAPRMDSGPSPTPTRTRPPPPPAPPAPPPEPSNGQGFLVTSAILGGSGILVRVWTTIAAARAGNRVDGYVSTSHLDVVRIGSYFYTPLLASGLATVGAGMGRMGHYDAHQEMFRYHPAEWKRRAWLGWSLFAGGMAIWTATRVGAAACSNDDCAFRVGEVGYYLSLAGTVPGTVVGSYGSGFASYRQRHRSSTTLTAAPMIGPRVRGLSLAARF